MTASNQGTIVFRGIQISLEITRTDMSMKALKGNNLSKMSPRESWGSEHSDLSLWLGHGSHLATAEFLVYPVHHLHNALCSAVC